MRRRRSELEREHEGCKAFQGDPERARAERIFREGLKRELSAL
jgi:hypothetical protein